MISRALWFSFSNMANRKKKKYTPAQKLGRLGGKANTPAQNAARARNAKKATAARRKLNSKP